MSSVRIRALASVINSWVASNSMGVIGLIFLCRSIILRSMAWTLPAVSSL